MLYDRAIDAPMHFQWDVDSKLPLPEPGSAPNNCGPTSVEILAHYYTGKPYGIYRTRRLGTSDDYRGTSIGEQQEMLRRRGVDCYFAQLTLQQVKFYGSTGRWPILLGLNMAYVPYDVAGHPFRGWHAVVRSTNSGVASGVIRDPNFNRTYRRDPTDGLRIYSDSVIQAAFVDTGGWALIPRKPAPEPVRYVNVDGIGTNIRSAPPKFNDLDNIFAETRRDGIYRRVTGNRLAGLGYDFRFHYWRDTERGQYAIVTGFGRRLAIARDSVHFV